MDEGRNAYRVLMGKPSGKRPLFRPIRRWKHNLKPDFIETGLGMEWINLALRAVVYTMMNFSSFIKCRDCV
jgi:hypothetical protein